MNEQSGMMKSGNTTSVWKISFPLLGLLFLLVALCLDTSVIKQFDMAFIELLQTGAGPDRTKWMEFTTFFGSSMWIFPVGILISAALAIEKKQRLSVFLIVTLILGRAANSLLKDLFQRERPQFDPLIIEGGYSFPSGHSMNAMVFSLAVAVVLVKLLKPSAAVWLSITLLSSIVVVVGATRIYLGVHYPSDVIAGFLAGASLVSACCWLFFHREKRTIQE